MSERPINCLFICTGNSARSILAEALLNHAGLPRVRGYSAGSQPRGVIHPIALALLRSHAVPVAGLRSKSWDEFAAPGAPVMDFVITMCDRAAGEKCPLWPGHPIIADWSVPDPAAPRGEPEQQRTFRRVFVTLQQRTAMLASAELLGSDRARLERLLYDIRDHAPLVDD